MAKKKTNTSGLPASLKEKYSRDESLKRATQSMKERIKNRPDNYTPPAKRELFEQIDSMLDNESERFMLEVAKVAQGEEVTNDSPLLQAVLTHEVLRERAINLYYEHKYAEEIANKILSLLDDEYPIDMFCQMVDIGGSINGLVILKLLSRVDINTLEKAKKIQSAHGRDGANKRHTPSRNIKAECIDFWRKNQPMSKRRAADYYSSHHPDGTKRTPSLNPDTVRKWLQGVDLAP